MLPVLRDVVMVAVFCGTAVIAWAACLFVLEQLTHWLGERRRKRAR